MLVGDMSVMRTGSKQTFYGFAVAVTALLPSPLCFCRYFICDVFFLSTVLRFELKAIVRCFSTFYRFLSMLFCSVVWHAAFCVSFFLPSWPLHQFFFVRLLSLSLILCLRRFVPLNLTPRNIHGSMR